jgi:RNA polymerase sigma factor (sigma-70 family)
MVNETESLDHELLGACRAGDADSFGTFYIRHREVLLGYLARRVENPEVAADLMAETFATALMVVVDPVRALPASPVAWLYSIAKNLMIDGARHGRVEAAARQRLGLGPLVLDDYDIERIHEIAEATDVVRDITASLSRPEWEAFRARVLDDEPYPELARRLRCSEAVARKRVSRAKAFLRTTLGGINA